MHDVIIPNIKITIRYIAKLILINDTYVFSFPIPSQITPHSKMEPRGLTVDISAEMNSPIHVCASETHEIETTLESTKAKIHYQTEKVTGRFNFVIFYLI